MQALAAQGLATAADRLAVVSYTVPGPAAAAAVALCAVVTRCTA